MYTNHYHTNNNNYNAGGYDDTEEGPLNAKGSMNDYSFNNNSNMQTFIDHPFNQTNKTQFIDEHLH